MIYQKSTTFLYLIRSIIVVGALIGLGRANFAQEAGPRLNSIFPPGGRAGSSFEISVGGSALEGLHGLICDEPRVTARPLGQGRFILQIPGDVPPGLYDLRARGDRGLSSPRTIFVSPHETITPVESDEGQKSFNPNVSICGLMETPGDLDTFRFHARAGQRVVIDCWAERLDSKLRAVLELEDGRGRRLMSNRGYTGLDPLIDYRAAEDGEFAIRVNDLTYAGGPEYVYRLDIETGPRIEFARPNVVERGKTSRVRVFGRNLGDLSQAAPAPSFDSLFAEIKAPSEESRGPSRIFSRPSRFEVEEFFHELPGSTSPVILGLTDVPVVTDGDTNHQPGLAQSIVWPLEVSGRLEDGPEEDWYRFEARRGEVLWLELYGERIGAPVDLELSIHDSSGDRELLCLTDRAEGPGSVAIPTSHTDPSGRWVAPIDGSYLIQVRNVIGGIGRDPRRIYRLSLRREEPDFRLLAIPGGDRDAGVCNLGRGGRALIELLALRRRGLSGPIRVTASGLPAGIEGPDVWFGPGVERVPVILSASRESEPGAWGLILTGHADPGGPELIREAVGATTIPDGSPTPSARLTGRIAVGVVPEAAWSLTATPSRSVVSQGVVVDLAVIAETPDGTKTGLVDLSAIGSPAERIDRLGQIPAGSSKGWYSFQVPEQLPPGSYTFAVRGETTLTSPAPKPGAKPVERTAVTFSNPVTIEVLPGAFELRLDPHNPPRIRRGQVIQIRYQAHRRNGFIGKIHTELTAPGEVAGLRARGVTFVGQTDSGSLQLVASDDAPLGRQPFLRLEGVGTVEDEPIHHAACFLDLEITE